MSRVYNYGFSLTFDSENDRDYYVDHPDHIKIAKEIIAFTLDGLDSVIVFDY